MEERKCNTLKKCIQFALNLKVVSQAKWKTFHRMYETKKLLNIGTIHLKCFQTIEINF